VTPIIAIVGRPNVGKSTLFNRLAGSPLAIVHDAPGVTRDRHYADARVGGRTVTIVDTGGFDPESDDPMGQGIRRHVEAAIEEADLVVCVLDGSSPPVQADRDAVMLLRKSKRHVIFVANKVDGRAQEIALSDHYELGVPELLGVSAMHGRHFGELERAIFQNLPKAVDEATGDDEELLNVALIGRPNAGKSSLFNRLAGGERSLVDSRPGTTRDPIDRVIEFKGDQFRLVDTAGVRRRTRVERGVEAESVIRSIRAVGRARVVILLCDVTEGISDQDARLLGLASERGRAAIVGLNKADLVSPIELEERKGKARDSLHFAKDTPILALSAHSGHGVSQLMRAVKEAGERMSKRVPTGELNRFFERILATQPPPTRGGRAPRLYYITQSGTNPPTFIVFCSSPEHVAESYRRFVRNQIVSEFDYQSVPIRLFFRGREKKDQE
jgi:GTP-binding protein